IVYTFTLYDANGNQLNQAQSVEALTPTAQSLGALIYPTTQAELATGLVINTTYNYGDMRRYGLVPNSQAAASNNTAFASTLFAPTVNGPSGNFYFVNTTGSDNYWFSNTIPIGDPSGDVIHIDGGSVTCTLTGSATANDQNSGLFYALD